MVYLELMLYTGLAFLLISLLQSMWIKSSELILRVKSLPLPDSFRLALIYIFVGLSACLACCTELCLQRRPSLYTSDQLLVRRIICVLPVPILPVRPITVGCCLNIMCPIQCPVLALKIGKLCWYPHFIQVLVLAGTALGYGVASGRCAAEDLYLILVLVLSNTAYLLLKLPVKSRPVIRRLLS